jgi:hypothetical protein
MNDVLRRLDCFEVDEQICREAAGDAWKLLMGEKREPVSKLKAVIRKPPTFSHSCLHLVTQHHATKPLR